MANAREGAPKRTKAEIREARARQARRERARRRRRARAIRRGIGRTILVLFTVIILAVAAVFDALVSKRPYKEGFPFEKAMAIIQHGSGNHFDPNVVRAFMEASDQVREVMNIHMSD